MLHVRSYAQDWFNFSSCRPWIISRFLWMLRVSLLLSALPCWGASYRTQNFLVSASSSELAREIGDAAEKYRASLAQEWLGKELPPWPQPCPISAKVDPRLGAGGATSFVFEMVPRGANRLSLDGGEVVEPVGIPHGWEMTLQGSRERVLDSVLPHEVTHTIFATHFGRPLPRWADEGACTTVEHESERKKQDRLLYEFLSTRRGIAFNRMFAMTEYPADILPLYSQGYSLARFLIAQGGKRKFVEYVGDGMASNNWTAATSRHYQFDNLSQLQVTWLDWVRRGGNDLELGTKTEAGQIASMPPAAARPNGESISSSIAMAQQDDNATPPEEAQIARRPGSWYARPTTSNVPTSPQSSIPVERVPKEVTRSFSPPSPLLDSTTSVRNTARPDSGRESREVLLEWGTPGPNLSPVLAAGAK